MNAEDFSVTAPSVDDVDGRDRVLVVDDEETVRHLFVRVLERAGFDATEAHDGKDALELISRESPRRGAARLHDAPAHRPRGGRGAAE